jgi:SAM-dependent methyltransferase
MNGTVAALPAHPRACPVCGSKEREVLYRQRFKGVSGGSLLAGYDVVLCRACGFAFADNLPDQEDFDSYYRELSKYENPERGGELSAFDLQRHRETAQIIAGIVPDREARVLDVGCATAGLLSSLQGLGYRRLLGLDPSPLCSELASRIHGIAVLGGAVAEIPENLGLFDLVILGSVLEHIRDLSGTLRRVATLLAPDGCLYVEVPDAAAFTCTRRDPPYQEFSTEHINYFSADSLANLMRANGFREIFSRRTSLALAPEIMLHDVKAAFRRDEAARCEMRTDTLTAAGLRSYVAASGRSDRAITAVIDRLVAARTPLIVWGVGTLTQRLLATGGLGKAEIHAFVDANPRYQGKHLGGIPVLSPEQLAGRSEAILISTLVYQDEIMSRVRNELRLKNELITFAASGDEVSGHA